VATSPRLLAGFPGVPLRRNLPSYSRPGPADDTVRIKGTYFRRTRGFLLTGPTEAHITHADPLELEERLSAPGTLAEVDVDLDRWRKTDPASFYPILSEQKPDPEEEGSHVYSLGRSLGTRVYERLLNRVRLTLVDGGSVLRLSMGLEPLAPGEIAPLPRPAFPRGVIGRVDIAYSSQSGSREKGFGFTTYTAGGARVTRMTFPGKKSQTLDFVDSGNTVRIVAAGDTQRRIAPLLKLPESGTLTSGFSGAFDPSAAVDAYMASGGSLPLPLRARVSLRGQQITWTTRAEGPAAVVDFDVPKPLAQAVIQLLGNRTVDLEASDQP